MIGEKLKKLLDSLEIGVDVLYNEIAYSSYHKDKDRITRGFITGIHPCEWQDKLDSNLCRECIGRIEIDHRGAKCMIYGDGEGGIDKCWIKEVVAPLEDFLDEKDMFLDL